jgi:hypothetical protein
MGMSCHVVCPNVPPFEIKQNIFMKYTRTERNICSYKQKYPRPLIALLR